MDGEVGIGCLLNGSANTNVFKTDGGFTFDQAKWIDWTVPALQ